MYQFFSILKYSISQLELILYKCGRLTLHSIALVSLIKSLYYIIYIYKLRNCGIWSFFGQQFTKLNPLILFKY